MSLEMELIFGGAYQGKLDYAISKYNTMNIYHCRQNDPHPAFDRDVIDALEEFVYACVLTGEDPLEYVKDNIDFLRDKVVIIKDISSGITPKDPVMLEWRRQNGLVMTYLGKEADIVTRILCGIPQKVK